MLQSIEEVYKNGNIELSELPSDVSESRVIVTFLEEKNSNSKADNAAWYVFWK
ncbi:hypothetical protein [Nostoc sphaeroides]|uniref:hypothetical protein n=1 Tax=Nostoc sphaeroides TaxID=446679 RepID=UPI003977842E